MAIPPAGTAELFVREAGTGPAVLLLHGLGGDHGVWNGQVDALAARYHVLAPDLRGHGRSPTPDGSTFTFDELEADIEGLLARHAVARVHLVGLSAGGFVALRFLLRHPERVASATLVGTAGHCDGHTRAVAAYWAEVYRDQGYEAYILRLLKDLYYAEWLEQHLDLIDETLAAMRGRDLRGAVQWGMALKTFDVRPQLGKVRTPTLVIHGMEDRVIDPSHARFLRQAIRGADLKLFPDVGHMVPVEKPAETTTVLLEWLARAEAAPPAEPGPN